MTPEGIEVEEIDLNLPRSSYYLRWQDRDPAGSRTQRVARLQAARGIAAGLSWRVHACAADPDGWHLLFTSRVANLDAGLVALLGDASRHRLFLVQDQALPAVGHRIREQAQTGSTVAGRSRHADPASLPTAHYGLFIGERAWADRMLASLTGPSPLDGPPPTGCVSLARIAARHADPRNAVAEAYRSRLYSLKDISDFFGMHFSEVSAIVNAAMTRHEAS